MGPLKTVSPILNSIQYLININSFTISEIKMYQNLSLKLHSLNVMYNFRNVPAIINKFLIA